MIPRLPNSYSSKKSKHFKKNKKKILPYCFYTSVCYTRDCFPWSPEGNLRPRRLGKDCRFYHPIPLSSSWWGSSVSVGRNFSSCWSRLSPCSRHSNRSFRSEIATIGCLKALEWCSSRVSCTWSASAGVGWLLPITAWRGNGRCVLGPSKGLCRPRREPLGWGMVRSPS